MHVTIVKGFHKYTRAAISPDGRLPGKSVPFSNHYQNSINGRKCKRLGMYSKRKIKYMQTIKVYNKGGIGILYSYLRLQVIHWDVTILDSDHKPYEETGQLHGLAMQW